ncbi:MAG: stage III sporulation protein AD [Clostridia bacterium]|nr:stage III sporulation protein AD [Clostridia bacterium]
MDVLRMAGMSMASAVAVILLRRMRPEMGLTAALAAGILLLTMAMPMVAQVIGGITSIAQTGGVKSSYLTQLLKVAGISLLMDFAAQTCRDAGEEGLAMKTELAGRVMLLTLALPAMQTLLTQLLSLAP